jgi:hypothetical protein
MEPNLNRLHDDAIHMSGFGGEDGAFVWLNAVPQVDSVSKVQKSKYQAMMICGEL